MPCTLIKDNYERIIYHLNLILLLLLSSTDCSFFQVHGLILLYWTARKASFAAMKAVTECCPLHWPKLFVGVGVNGREVCLQEGQHLAHDLDSSFIHIQPENTDHRGKFFFIVALMPFRYLHFACCLILPIV